LVLDFLLVVDLRFVDEPIATVVDLLFVEEPGATVVDLLFVEEPGATVVLFLLVLDPAAAVVDFRVEERRVDEPPPPGEVVGTTNPPSGPAPGGAGSKFRITLPFNGCTGRTFPHNVPNFSVKVVRNCLSYNNNKTKFC